MTTTVRRLTTNCIDAVCASTDICATHMGLSLNQSRQNGSLCSLAGRKVTACHGFA
jgi:hypothetical protein